MCLKLKLRTPESANSLSQCRVPAIIAVVRSIWHRLAGSRFEQHVRRRAILYRGIARPYREKQVDYQDSNRIEHHNNTQDEQRQVRNPDNAAAPIL